MGRPFQVKMDMSEHDNMSEKLHSSTMPQVFWLRYFKADFICILYEASIFSNAYQMRKLEFLEFLSPTQGDSVWLKQHLLFGLSDSTVCTVIVNTAFHYENI